MTIQVYNAYVGGLITSVPATADEAKAIGEGLIKAKGGELLSKLSGETFLSALHQTCSYGPYSYGLYGHGPYSYGVYSYDWMIGRLYIVMVYVVMAYICVCLNQTCHGAASWGHVCLSGPVHPPVLVTIPSL